MKPTTPLQEGMSEEVMPWKKEFILSLFKQQKILRIILTVLGLLLIVLIVHLVFIGVTLYNENKAALNWLLIPCTVVDVKIHWDAKESGMGFWDPGNPSWREDLSRIEDLGGGHIYTFHYEIEYQYTFQDRNYSSNRYSIQRQYEMLSRDSHRGEYFYGQDSQYQKIRQGHCYVNPQNPNQSVLVRTPLSTSDYALHMFRPFFTILLYSIIPTLIYKKYSDNKKQLSELITGKKENILDGMNRFLDTYDPDLDASS